MPLVLVTRPEPDARRFAEILVARGHTALIAPLLEIAPVAWRLERLPAGIILTSRHVLPALAAYSELRALRCFVVGAETARLAREAGCTRVTSAPTVTLLREEITRAAPPLLYLRGRDVAQDIGGVDQAVVYEARPAAQLSDEACAAFRTGAIAAAAFFSARTARVFTALAEVAGIVPHLHTADAVAMSDPVAAALAGLPWRGVVVSNTPDAEGMAEAIDNRLRGR